MAGVDALEGVVGRTRDPEGMTLRGAHDPNVVDSQPGCAGLLMAMMALDPTITFTGATISPAVRVTPRPPEKPAAPSLVNPAKGSIAFIANIFNAVFRRKS